MRNSEQRPSPFLGWFEAGADLLAAQLSKVTATVNDRIDESHQLFDELQHKGEAIEARMRATLNPQAVLGTLHDAVTHNPIVTAMTPGRSQKRLREAQLDVLSAKVDALVEHVALLAAKQAATKAKAAEEAKSAAEKEKPKAVKAQTVRKTEKQTAPSKQISSEQKKPTEDKVTKTTSSPKSRAVANRRKAPPASRRTTAKPTTKK
ncbi:hypothetical protein OPS25_07530 [Alteromonas ponticola]|uniref:Phasin domain-containing protein n=1 Tax=Alteromonas aquimaris TaxID=2998417 RepID=A0ABT3P6E8_9ALTE|nr:hypothetical protein [Alteromonas aquimaris]MCW8108342.1 hypothetical protein [Alteromonas aquimaris]